MTFFLHDVKLPDCTDIKFQKFTSKDVEKIVRTNQVSSQPTWESTTTVHYTIKNLNSDQVDQAIGRLKNMPFLVLRSDTQILYDQHTILLVIIKDWNVEPVSGFVDKAQLTFAANVVGFWTHEFEISMFTKSLPSDWQFFENVFPIFGNEIVTNSETFNTKYEYVGYSDHVTPTEIVYVSPNTTHNSVKVTYDLNAFSKSGYRIYNKDEVLVTQVATVRDTVYFVLGLNDEPQSVRYKVTKNKIEAQFNPSSGKWITLFSVGVDVDLLPLQVYENNVFQIRTKSYAGERINWGLENGPFLHVVPETIVDVSLDGTVTDSTVSLVSDNGPHSLVLSKTHETSGSYVFDGPFGVLLKPKLFNENLPVYTGRLEHKT